jgi:Ca-activated chloride channel family protein
MAAIDALRPSGRTPLTGAVAQAGEALDFRHRPGLIVVLTDGEETCWACLTICRRNFMLKPNN